MAMEERRFSTQKAMMEHHLKRDVASAIDRLIDLGVAATATSHGDGSWDIHIMEKHYKSHFMPMDVIKAYYKQTGIGTRKEDLKIEEEKK
jgi:hypothetical protein